MVTTCKAESENEEIQDKVRARAAVATDPGEGKAELGQQIAKLMAALTKAGQGSNSSIGPSSPQERGCRRECNDSNTLSSPNCHNGRNGPGKTPQPAAYPMGMGQGAMELGVMDRAIKGLAQGGRASQ